MRIRRKLTESEELQIVKEYKETDISASRLYEKFHTNYYKIKEILKKYNVQLKGTENFTQEQKEEIFDLYCNKKLSLNKIEKIIGINRQTIANFLKRENKELRFKQQKYNINENYFEKIDSHEKAYWLGILWTDGYLEEKRSCFGLMIQERDIETLNKFKKCLNLDMPIKTFIRHKNGREYRYVYLKITNVKMTNDLKRVGLHQCKTFSIKYPPIDDEYFFSFLLGAFDGDGSFSLFKSKGRTKFTVSLISASKEFIMELKQKLDYLKFPLNLIVRDNSKRGRKTTYSLYSGHRIYCCEFLNRLYKNINENIYLSRKYDKFLAAKQSLIDSPVNIKCIRR